MRLCIVWGAAQAIAFGLGGLLGTGVIDVMRYFVGSTTLAYSSAFTMQAAFFLVASILAANLSSERARAFWSAQTDGEQAAPLTTN